MITGRTVRTERTGRAEAKGDDDDDDGIDTLPNPSILRVLSCVCVCALAVGCSLDLTGRE